MKLIYAKTVPMKPFGKARPRVTRNGTHMPQQYQDRRDELRLHCLDMPQLDNQSLKLDVAAVRPMPQSWSQKKRERMNGKPTTAKPDLDNIIGAVMDALLPNDDSNIVSVAGHKVWGEEPAIEIALFEIDQQAPPF